MTRIGCKAWSFWIFQHWHSLSFNKLGNWASLQVSFIDLLLKFGLIAPSNTKWFKYYKTVKNIILQHTTLYSIIEKHYKRSFILQSLHSVHSDITRKSVHTSLFAVEQFNSHFPSGKRHLCSTIVPAWARITLTIVTSEGMYLGAGSLMIGCWQRGYNWYGDETLVFDPHLFGISRWRHGQRFKYHP